MTQENHDSYETPKGVRVCDLHINTIKEIGVIKSMFVKMGKKIDRAALAFLCLAGFVAIDTIVIVWKLVVEPIQLTFLK